MASSSTEGPSLEKSTVTELRRWKELSFTATWIWRHSLEAHCHETSLWEEGIRSLGFKKKEFKLFFLNEKKRDRRRKSRFESRSESFSKFAQALQDLIFCYLKCQWTLNLGNFWANVSLGPKEKTVFYVITWVESVCVATDYTSHKF